MSLPERLPPPPPESLPQFTAAGDPDIAQAAAAARDLLDSAGAAPVTDAPPPPSAAGNDLRPYFSSNEDYKPLAIGDPTEREIDPAEQKSAEESSDKQRISYLEEHASQLEGIAEQLREQVAKLQSQLVDFKQVKKLAFENAVSGLPNRLKFAEKVDERIAQGQPTAVALIDITKFKEVNDRYGHEMGDTVLKEIGALLNAILQLNEHTRKDDQLFHLSGDELAIIFDATPRKNDSLTPQERTAAIKDNLRKAVDNYALLSALDALGLSIAIGISPVEAGMTGSQALKAADAEMYRNKAAQYEARGLKPRGD